MRGYKIKKRNNKWYFALYPNNNNNQCMGESKEYDSLDDCKAALIDFKEFVEAEKLNKPIEGKVNIIRSKINGINYYVFQYLKNEEIIFYRTKPYEQREGCKKGIKSIYDYKTEYTTKQKFD